MSLSVIGIFAMPQFVSAQQLSPKDSKVPECPTHAGQIGDWSWEASHGGRSLQAKRFTVLARGDAIRGRARGDGDGDADSVYVYLGLRDKWILDMNFSRGPTNSEVAIIAENG
jgi:hypothetical protein